MDESGLRARLLRRESLCGTFVKTPAYEVIEVLALAGLDFVILDAEHAPFDRARMDACLAMARALGLPCMVRVPEATPARILMALDSGAAGVVVPHCFSVEKAQGAARAARFGHGGRGFAGSTRWAGYATKGMADVLAMGDETILLGQIEEPEGVEAAEAIAAVDGIDGLFVGPADLAVCYGERDMNAPVVRDAMRRACAAAEGAGKAAVTFAGNADTLPDLLETGITTMVFASEHAFMLAGARQVVGAFRKATG